MFSVVHNERSFIGVGAIYLKPKASAAGFYNIGNCGQLEFAFDEEKKEQPNYMTPGGGNANSLSKISSFTGSMTLIDYTPENLALALRGSVTAVTAGAVVDEAQASVGNDGELIPTSFPIDHTQAITVKKTDDTALAVDTDYTVTSNGIVVVGTGGIDATGVKISYTKAAGAIMEALVASGEEFTLLFDGLNDAQNGAPVNIRCHRIKMSPTSGLNFLGGEFGEIPITFDVVSDGDISGSGLSKYVKITQAT